MARVGNEPQLGVELKRLRERSGRTLREVSESTGVSNAYINQLENDKVGEPSPNILAKLADFYRVPYLRLMKLAGYVVPRQLDPQTIARQTSHIEGLKDLNQEELEQVRNFVEFLRIRKLSPKK